MLSRVAERMYWLGRYMDRVENTARMININTMLVLDMPKVTHIWGSIIDICGAEEHFANRFTVVDEQNVVRFLLDDQHCSLLSSVHAARENARSIREVIPSEAWTVINSLYLYIQQNHTTALARKGRHRFLTEVITRCYQLIGLLAGNMSNDTGYTFLRIGRNLERADMTTRILDVGSTNLYNPLEKTISEHDNILWMSVLRSLTAYQMYRQQVQDRVNGEDVVEFLLKSETFPRAARHCLGELQMCFEKLPHNDLPLRSIAHVIRSVVAEDVIAMFNANELSDFIDQIQLDISAVHDSVHQCWFEYQRDELATSALG